MAIVLFTTKSILYFLILNRKGSGVSSTPKVVGFRAVNEMKNNKYHDTNCFEDSLKWSQLHWQITPPFKIWGAFMFMNGGIHDGDEEEWKIPENGLFEMHLISRNTGINQIPSRLFYDRTKKLLGLSLSIKKEAMNKSIQVAQFFILKEIQKEGHWKSCSLPFSLTNFRNMGGDGHAQK